KLLFLVRDWSYPYEATYGLQGGKKILEKRLTISEKQHPELQQLRKHIRACFGDTSCFLLPHPGLKVATNPHFDGRLSDIANNFRENLKVLVPYLLSSENLILKEVNGKKITCKELLEYFKAYVKIFQCGELPEPKTMLVATAEANNLAAVTNAKDHYSIGMEKICGGDQPYISSAQLELHHQHLKNECEILFNYTRKMGGEEFSRQYCERLLKELDLMYINYKKNNDGKNIFAAAKTPATLFTLVLVMYFSSGIFSLIGMLALSNLCNLIMGVVLLTLCLWTYIKYSGDMRDVGSQIDVLSLTIFKQILKPAYKIISEHSLSHLISLAEEPSVTNLVSLASQVKQKVS
ncbi:atlastin-2, partial [Caerostris extrusa]